MTLAPSPPAKVALRQDAILAAIVTVSLGVLTIFLVGSVGYPRLEFWIFGVVVALAIAGAILVRRTHPVLALSALTVLALVHVVIHAPLFPLWLGVLVVLYSAGRFAEWPGRLTAIGLAFVGAVLAAIWFAADAGWFWSGYLGPIEILIRIVSVGVPPLLLFTMAILVGWGVSAVARSRAASARAAESTLRADEQKERAALARDMHDVVAHSLAVVIAQANGARYTEDLSAKNKSLEAISGTAKQALGDVRLLLEQLRHSQAADPVASLEMADALVERLRASGLTVNFERVGPSVTLPRTADIAAYRILQEALTNALRHGDRGQPVHVRLLGVAQPQPSLVLDVHNRLSQNAAPSSSAVPLPAGHGVRGMHERARLAGGEAWTGIDRGWFRVRAAFPAGVGT